MRTMNCGNVRREIEEAPPGGFLSSTAAEHLSNCAECLTFRDEETKLRELMSGLGTVNAPDDFDFRLRARLAGEKSGSVGRFQLTGLSFGVRSVALASMLLMFGATMLVVSLRSSRESSSSAGLQTPTPASNTTVETASPGGQSSVAEVKPDAAASTIATADVRPAVRSSAIASGRNTARTRTRDSGARQATVLNSDLNARASDFQIQGSRQPLKMSLDDGRGSSRTISLPSVSFGSQRVLSQNTSPLIASARGSW
jgi:hypothetical protein